MPLYDYRCRACAAELELLLRSSSSTPPACPRCGTADTLERQLSRIAPAGKIAGIVASNRRAAAAEGHFSHYSKTERGKLPR